MDQHLSPRRRAYDLGLRLCMIFCAGVTCALLIFLIGYIFCRGLPNLTWDLLSGQTSYIRNTVGILPNLLNTLYIILVAMAVVLPLGVGAAIYLTEYAASGRLVRIIEFAAETLTGIPSIIFGLVGMMLFVQKLGLQAGILAGGLTLVMMILPTIIAVVCPIVVGLILGYMGVVGMLAGATVTGFLMAIYMANAGGAWDNAKKYIEAGHFGGKGSDCHKAGVVGDTVGDPFKDTSGPAINILIKLLSMVSIVFAGLVVNFHLL